MRHLDGEPKPERTWPGESRGLSKVDQRKRTASAKALESQSSALPSWFCWPPTGPLPAHHGSSLGRSRACSCTWLAGKLDVTNGRRRPHAFHLGSDGK